MVFMLLNNLDLHRAQVFYAILVALFVLMFATAILLLKKCMNAGELIR